MIFVDSPLSKKEIEDIKKEYGSYVKVTCDIENKWIMVGCELHADAEETFFQKGSKQDDIWGGGINLIDKIIDTTAVLNICPRMKNDSMELLDPVKREKYVSIVKSYFNELWH
jgi:hypothetical protein